MANSNYFIEWLGTMPNLTGSFNLWQRDRRTFRNLATLFLNDPMCGCQWDVSERQRAISYGEAEMKDELENPLREVPEEIGEHLVSMGDKSYGDVFEYLQSESKDREHIAGLKFYRKSGDNQNYNQEMENDN